MSVKRRRVIFSSVFVALVIFVVLVATNVGAIHRQLNDWKLLPRQERLTELYFTHPNNLPATYTPGQPQTVSFTVHNLEYRTVVYHYEIIERGQTSDKSQTLATGSFTLGQNQYKRPAVTIDTVNLGTKAKISVDLKTVNESIDYHFTKEGL